jgi:hypothetical protein
MSTKNWNYLGCYTSKDEETPVIPNKPHSGQKNVGQCYNLSNKHSFFSLQTDGSTTANCISGHQMNGLKVDDKHCNALCRPFDDLYMQTGKPGCGSMKSGKNNYYSVYEINKSLNPGSIKRNRSNLLVTNSDNGEKFKDGLYKFSDSGHSWCWSAKRAFDNNEFTFWMSPYLVNNSIGGYDHERSKNYSEDGYIHNKNSSDLRASYNNRQIPMDKNRQAVNKDGDRSPYITHTTIETTPGIIGDQLEHNGEWVQIELPYKLFLTSFSMKTAKIQPRNEGTELMRLPRRYVLLGSNDGKTWILIYNQASLHETSKGLMNIIDIQSSAEPSEAFNKLEWNHIIGSNGNGAPESFSMYRLIIKETHGARAAAIGNILLKGNICTNLAGNCNKFDTEQNKKLMSLTNPGAGISMGALGWMEGFQNNEIIEESFMNSDSNIKDTETNMKELNIFNSDYSLYN